MKAEAFLRYQVKPLALVNQSIFLLVSLTFLHLSGSLSVGPQYVIWWFSAVVALLGFQNTMDSMNQNQDLAAILQTLAAYAPPQLQVPQTQLLTQLRDGQDIEENDYDPATDYDPVQPLLSTPHPPESIQYPPASEPQQQLQPLRRSQTPPAPPPAQKPLAPPGPNPSTITAWGPAARHVAHLISTSPPFKQHIAHLIRSQHSHERQWWSSRLTLLSMLSSRDEKKRKLDSVLTSIGGNVIAPTGISASELPPEKEMEIFDRKVHRACREMVKSAERELKGLEVPFFCTKEELIFRKGSGEMRKGMVDEEELVRLQKKMLELLEDLCGEEGDGT